MWNLEFKVVLLLPEIVESSETSGLSKAPKPPKRAMFLDWHTYMYIMNAPESVSKVLHKNMKAMLTFYFKQLRKQQNMF